nr:hypothetical protein BaRGS_009080 [Batillaria attramentaria]KAG5711194.1 hypothetical protein BaRGS_004838 [Batillaria attramentaria]
MVWAGFTYDRKIALEVIDGNMTVVKYRDDILCDVILPFKQQHPVENFILVDDNATSHRARLDSSRHTSWAFKVKLFSKK